MACAEATRRSPRVVRRGDEFLAGERPLPRVGLGVGDVHRGVPLVTDLDRMRPEPALALTRPVIGRIGDIRAERPDRLGIVPQRRPFQVAHRTQVGQPFIHLMRRPRPRELVGVPGERQHRLLPALHRPERQIPGQLLIAPPVPHRRGGQLMVTVKANQPTLHGAGPPRPVVVGVVVQSPLVGVQASRAMLISPLLRW
jgi:hypothetical protein